MQKQSNVIVSGATGFIGQYVVPLLLQKGLNVIALGRDIEKAKSLSWYKDVKFVPCNFPEPLDAVNFADGAGLIHLAWQGLPNYKSSFHLEENLPASMDFIKSMVMAGVSRVFVAGTCYEYGMKNGPIDVSTPTEPVNAYAAAKDSLHKYLRALRIEHPFTLQWGRLFYMYGRGQNPHSILSQLDTAIERGDEVFNMSGGEQLRDYLPVGRVAEKIVNIFCSGDEGVYNICSGAPISIRRLVEEHIKGRGASIKLNLGYYPYADYEPMAFWGIPRDESV